MTKLSKSDLSEQVENLPFGLSKGAAKTVVDVIFSRIRDEVEAGNTVTLRSFGTFSLRHREERLGRNPRTGEAVTIPASDSIGFKASKPGPTAD